MSTPLRRSIAFASLTGAAGVVLGALGAHKLRPFLEAHDRLGAWETAVHYHLVHAAVLLAIALYLRLEREAVVARRVARAGDLLAAGVWAFSGSLYALALGGPRWLGPVTPLGGLCLVAGWLALGAALWPRKA